MAELKHGICLNFSRDSTYSAKRVLAIVILSARLFVCPDVCYDLVPNQAQIRYRLRVLTM